MDTAAGELIERLKQYVISDAQEQRQELERQWAAPLFERVRRGLAIQDLRLVGQQEKGIFVLAAQQNNSRFREGDLLVLHRGSPLMQPTVECVLEYEDDEYLYVTITGGESSVLSLELQGWIADEASLDLSSFYLKALDQVADSALGRENILPLLQNTCNPQFDYERYERSYAQAKADGLNDSQAEATAMAYAADLFHMVQGPPGTGKTRVLANLCRQFVLDGQRVLVTSLTHRAINNALNQLFSLDPALPVCKVGQAVRARDLLGRSAESFAESPLVDLEGGYVIGATPFASQTSRLQGVEFDVVVFDEASQVTLPLALMGMLTASKYIFIGDERQLPPVNSGRKSSLGRQSIFTYLNGRGAETMLEITYRMNRELTHWPSRMFYEGLLRSDASAAARRLKMQPVYSPWDFALHPDEPIVFIDTRQVNTTNHSRIEAGIVCDLIQALRRGQIPLYEIGVVTPYRAQARLVRRLLRQAGFGREELDDLVVDTVERMQGQEREVVIVSWATSNRAYAQDLAEFLYQPERLNVAITRPRTKLIMVGSRELLLVQPQDETVAGWVELLRDLLEACVIYSAPAGSAVG